jgi:hypothetical protein
MLAIVGGGDGWIPWDGTKPFTTERAIRVRFRNGQVSKEVLPARKWRGKHGDPWPDDWPFDVVAIKPEG